MEDIYRQSLVKSFKKQVDDGYFTFLIVDCINDKTKHYSEMWSYAKQRGFEVRTANYLDHRFSFYDLNFFILLVRFRRTR